MRSIVSLVAVLNLSVSVSVSVSVALVLMFVTIAGIVAVKFDGYYRRCAPFPHIFPPVSVSVSECVRVSGR